MRHIKGLITEHIDCQSIETSIENMFLLLTGGDELSGYEIRLAGIHIFNHSFDIQEYMLDDQDIFFMYKQLKNRANILKPTYKPIPSSNQGRTLHYRKITKVFFI